MAWTRRLLASWLLTTAWLTSAAARAVVTVPSHNTKETRLQRDTDFVRSAAAGGVAACAATVTFHPVDTVKTVLQGGGGGASRGGVAAVRALGFRGLYRGVVPAAFSMMPACAVRMGAYEALKGVLLQRETGRLSPGAVVFLASALSVVVSCSVRSPLGACHSAHIMLPRTVRCPWWLGGDSTLTSACGGPLARLDVYRYGQDTCAGRRHHECRRCPPRSLGRGRRRWRGAPVHRRRTRSDAGRAVFWCAASTSPAPPLPASLSQMAVAAWTSPL